MKPNQNGVPLPFKPMSVTVPLDHVGQGLETLAGMAAFNRFTSYTMGEARYSLYPGCPKEDGPYITFNRRDRDDEDLDPEDFELPDCASLDTVAQITYDRFRYWEMNCVLKAYGLDDTSKLLSVRMDYIAGTGGGQLECRLTVPVTLAEEVRVNVEEAGLLEPRTEDG